MFCPLSKYKDIAGLIGTCIHKYRFLGISAVDFFVTILMAVGITWFFKVPLDLSIIGILVLSLIVHLLFGVETGALKYLGLTCK